MKKIIRLTESDLTRIVRRVINEQSSNISSVTTPDVVENFFRKNINNFFDGWVSLEKLKKAYSILSPLSGKMVKGVSKCFNEEWQTAGKPINMTVLSYLNKLSEWSIQDKCGENNGGPSTESLMQSIKMVGTKTLGPEGEQIKKQLIDLLIKNGIRE